MKKVLTMVMAVLVVFGFCACSKNTQEKKFVVLKEGLGAEKYGIGFRNEDVALGLKVQEIMDEMILDGKAEEISKKWFGKDVLLKNEDYIEDVTIADNDKSLQKVLDKGTFILGLDDSFPPMGFRNENNEITGFDVDLANEVAKRMGVKLILQPIDWEAKELELKSGRIDCIWNGMTINESRVENMFFAKAYIANSQVVIVPENSKIKGINDLAGKKVALQKGSSSLEALNKNPVSQEVKQIVQLADNITAFLELKTGRVDAFIVDEVVGRYMLTNE